MIYTICYFFISFAYHLGNDVLSYPLIPLAFWSLHLKSHRFEKNFLYSIIYFC